MTQATSVAIIGGADGPTAIFVASKLSPLALTGLCLLAAALIAFGIYRRAKRRRDRRGGK